MISSPASSLNRRSFILSSWAAAATSLVDVQSLYSQGMKMWTGPRMQLGMVLFDGFQLLDTFGPLEMFGDLHGRFQITIIGEKPGVVKSSAGPVIAVDQTFATAPKLDVVMIPGGGGTRREVNNASFVSSLKTLAEATPHVASICTGAAVLAKTGLLDGRKATTNKRAYAWATSQGPNVKWVPQARWVEDGKYFTSSGISAGTDMALGLIARLLGREAAIDAANAAEYEWNEDSHHDPFAKLNGLVS